MPGSFRVVPRGAARETDARYGETLAQERRACCISTFVILKGLTKRNLASFFEESFLHEVFILSAVRTPIGKFGGSLAHMTAADMGVLAAKAALERARVSADDIEETIIGNARQ